MHIQHRKSSPVIDLEDATIPILDNIIRIATQIRNSKTQLLSLPPEIRNEIWSLALIADFQHQQQDHRQKHQEYLQKQLQTNRYQPTDQHTDTTPILIPHPPLFISSSRQIKLESESILYTEIMLWYEHKHPTSCIKLHPYQIHGLFRIRDLGVPILKLSKNEKHTTGMSIWHVGTSAYVNFSRDKCGFLRVLDEVWGWELRPLIKRQGGVGIVVDVEKWPGLFEGREGRVVLGTKGLDGL